MSEKARVIYARRSFIKWSSDAMKQTRGVKTFKKNEPLNTEFQAVLETKFRVSENIAFLRLLFCPVS